MYAVVICVAPLAWLSHRNKGTVYNLEMTKKKGCSYLSLPGTYLPSILEDWQLFLLERTQKRNSVFINSFDDPIPSLPCPLPIHQKARNKKKNKNWIYKANKPGQPWTESRRSRCRLDYGLLCIYRVVERRTQVWCKLLTTHAYTMLIHHALTNSFNILLKIW